MPASLNHTIIASQDRQASARFYRELPRPPRPPRGGCAPTSSPKDGVMLQFAEPPVEIQMQHHAILIDDELFDRTYSRLLKQGIKHWADPRKSRHPEDQYRGQ